MRVTQSFRLVVLMLWLGSGVVACALKAQGVVRTQRSYDEVFQASLMAIQETEFMVTSQDSEQGTLVAVKRLPTAEGDTMRMAVRINRAPTGLTVIVTVVHPSGTPATEERPCKCHVKRFVYALESRLPDVQVVSIH